MTTPHVAETALLRQMDRIIIALLPDACRDAIAGDLVEEATHIASTSGSRDARRWIRAQLIRSLPGVVSLHFRQKENGMKHAKLIAPMLVVLAAVQAWDSGILNAPIFIGILVALAIAVGVAGVFIGHEGIKFGLAILVLILLFAARLLSPVRLPELGLVGFPIFMVLVLGPKLLPKARRTGGPSATA